MVNVNIVKKGVAEVSGLDGGWSQLAMGKCKKERKGSGVLGRQRF